MILALDLAQRTGYCIGRPGEKPVSGSIRFASVGASHEACFANAQRWMSDMVKAHQPTTVVWEAPLPTSFRRGATNVDTSTILYGLPAIIGAVAYLHGIFDIRKARVRDVRQHFIGSNPRGALGKQLTMRQCRAMGYTFTDDNEADAIAVWHFMCSIIEPKLAVAQSPLFLRKGTR